MKRWNKIWVFFLLTPFFVTSMMLTATPDWPDKSRRKLALLIGFSGLLICATLLFFGRFIFDAFGITVDAFRIGGGLLLGPVWCFGVLRRLPPAAEDEP